MTKPITAAAAMILVEECKLRLDEPVDRWLPELANSTVLKRLDGPLDDTEPAQRPITVRDLRSEQEKQYEKPSLDHALFVVRQSS